MTSGLITNLLPIQFYLRRPCLYTAHTVLLVVEAPVQTAHKHVPVHTTKNVSFCVRVGFSIFSCIAFYNPYQTFGFIA